MLKGNLIMDYETTDIVLAAFLKINGCQMVAIEKQGQKGTFLFKNVSDDLIKMYDLGQARVEPVIFNNTIKQLTTSVKRMN
jgi:hypothetical protein